PFRCRTHPLTLVGVNEMSDPAQAVAEIVALAVAASEDPEADLPEALERAHGELQQLLVEGEG
ncbi:MAG: hypothetical protein LBJ08_08180, partial [Bifidobacteriaceae bacterium]|nr:hypothetical protein [Bifidobacteriaceae bacterium]